MALSEVLSGSYCPECGSETEQTCMSANWSDNKDWNHARCGCGWRGYAWECVEEKRMGFSKWFDKWQVEMENWSQRESAAAAWDRGREIVDWRSVESEQPPIQTFRPLWLFDGVSKYLGRYLGEDEWEVECQHGTILYWAYMIEPDTPHNV